MTSDPHLAARERVARAVLDGPGVTPSALRHAAATRRDLPDDLAPLVAKIEAHAYRVSDDDVARVQRARGDDATFEVVVSAALGAATRRLDAGLRALEDA